MKGFDAKFIDEVKNKNDLVDTVSRYVKLVQRGRSFWGCCPFHHEKTPSFCVNSTEQFYHCFGCHKSGDVITFIQEMESLDFSDAVKFLAERSGIPLPEIEYDTEYLREQKKKKERLLSLLRDSALFYVSNLKKEQAVAHVEYILKRKLTSETVAKFGIGASLDFNGVVNHLKAKGYTEQEMIDSGVVGKNKNGNLYDFLAGRLIIPGIDQFNNVISFCGRIIDGRKDVGKYVNTRETFVFNKGKTLFNINNLKKLKNEKGLDSIIIVEGHMDVVSLVQAGIRNVVASMGTALTQEQARILKRYASKVYISYDGDSAGQNATIRGLDILKDEGLDVKVVSLPDGMDPDDVVKKLGLDAYNKLILEAKPLIDFKLDLVKKSFDLTTSDGKRKYVVSACKVIKESSSPTEQEELLKQVRDATGITFETLKRELYSLGEEKKEPITNNLQFTETGNKSLIASRFVLYAYLFSKEFAFEIDINEFEFEKIVHRQIQSYISNKVASGEKTRFTDLYELIDDEAELSAISGMETEENGSFDQEIYFKDCTKTVKTDALNKKIDVLKKRFSEETDTEIRKAIATEMSLLISKKNKLK